MNPITNVADGALYDANYDERVVQLRTQAKLLCYEYNHSKPGDNTYRTTLLKGLLGKCGNSIIIEPPFFCDYGPNISVGENFYANHNLIILDGAPVTIGDNVFIAPNVGLHTAGHPIDADRRNKGLEYALPITIGNNVWIGASVTIIPGVTIGDNTVIGAGSVVTRDIPADVVAVGNPCRVLRKITEEDARRENY
ncbi:MAG TPA: sugar O-acetyltransferase [Cellvibrio sp.]|nr:sugar O-acetyltransferase [Cellvibrio sp.]